MLNVDMLCLDGFFYRFFRTQKAIGASNVASREWEILLYPPLNGKNYLFESDGSILSYDLCWEILPA